MVNKAEGEDIPAVVLLLLDKQRAAKMQRTLAPSDTCPLAKWLVKGTCLV